jgi:hypothetical protein
LFHKDSIAKWTYLAKFRRRPLLESAKQQLHSNSPAEKFRLDCSGELVTQLSRRYAEINENGTTISILWFVCASGVVEFFGVLLV